MLIFLGIMIPFIGTTLGSFMVFFMKKELNWKIEKMLTAFAAGVMIAASIWSLLIPAMDMSTNFSDKLRWIPSAIGFIVGILFLLLLDHIIPHLHANDDQPEGPKSHLKKTTMLVTAVTLHNIPEGLAVGVVLAGAYYGSVTITMSGALALAIGIAIQNFPEGAIISMPLCAAGASKPKSFILGTLSGIVEPIAAALTLLIVGVVETILPYVLSFAAGAMMYVCFEELIPSSHENKHSNLAIIAFSFGFIIMMVLDVRLG